MPQYPHQWQQAATLAARYHRQQFRKDGVTPYVVHPFRVAFTIRHLFGVTDDVVLAAALLHDLIEDTAADMDDLLAACGPEVANLVAALTKDRRLPEAQREAAYDQQLAAAPWTARLIKLADVYDNVCDCPTPEMRAKAAGKARRALALAGDDARLATAVTMVRELLATFERQP